MNLFAIAGQILTKLHKTYVLGFVPMFVVFFVFGPNCFLYVSPHNQRVAQSKVVLLHGMNAVQNPDARLKLSNENITSYL